jgi:hypothetical protein
MKSEYLPYEVIRGGSCYLEGVSVECYRLPDWTGFVVGFGREACRRARRDSAGRHAGLAAGIASGICSDSSHSSEIHKKD